MCSAYEFRKKNGKDLKKVFKNHHRILDIGYLDEDEKQVKSEGMYRPTNKVHVIQMVNGKPTARILKWAIKCNIFASGGFKEINQFNSRIETVTKKGSKNRKLLEDSRCIMPMTHFVEWTGEKKNRLKNEISIVGEEIFYAAGIINEKDLAGEAGVSMVTCTPNKFMTPIHNRMPVLFKFDEAMQFLEAGNDVVEKLCCPLDNKIKMSIKPVPKEEEIEE